MTHETYHPWHVLRDDYASTIVHYAWLPDGTLGTTNGHDIWLHKNLTQAERRCTLTHELVHLERGHDGCQPPAVERSVEAEAARRLIPIERLGDAIEWAGSIEEAAEELWVDTHTLMTRVTNLDHTERGYLASRFDWLAMAE